MEQLTTKTKTVYLILIRTTIINLDLGHIRDPHCESNSICCSCCRLSCLMMMMMMMVRHHVVVVGVAFYYCLLYVVK